MTELEVKARSYIQNVPVYCAFDEIVDITKLKPNPKNPNTHPKEQIELLSEVIMKTGWRAPITVSTLSGLIVKGHGRLSAARLAKFESCPVEYQNFKDEQEELAALLADNKIAESAEIDAAKLTDLFKNIDFEDLSLTGYSQSEFDSLLGELSNIDVSDDLNNLKVSDAQPFTQLGDIWILGKHKLICADATVSETYSNLLNGELADIVLTDPPYNVNYEGGTADKLTIRNDDMTDEDFASFLTKAFTNIDANMKAGASFYIWHADSKRYLFQSACINADWEVRQCLIWIKNAFVIGRQDYQWKYEPCLYGWKTGAAHYFIDDRTLTTCFEFDKPQRSDIHPTMKPVELFSFLLGNSSKNGSIVLDAFAGSGTTLVACQKLKRFARLIELDEKYCDAIVKRFISLDTGEPIKCYRQGKEIKWELPE